MLNIRSILVPTDFSGCSDMAVRLASELAPVFGSELQLLHVMDPAEDSVQPTGSDESMTAWRAATNAHREARGTAGHVKILSGQTTALASVLTAADPVKAILDFGRDLKTDLIVLGTHGHESVRRFLNDTQYDWSIGRTARAVLPESRSAVLSVGPRVRLSPEGFDRVVVPVDLTRHSSTILQHAVALGELLGAGLHLVHVVPQGTPPAERAHARREVAELARQLGITPESVQILAGRPAESIVRFAGQAGTRPILVIGSHGHRSRTERQIGRVADRIIRSSPAPVLTVKPFGHSLLTEMGRNADRKRTVSDPDTAGGFAGIS